MFYLPYKTYRQTDDEDLEIKYIPKGNSKFGAVEIQSDSSMLHYRLFIDGNEVWTHTIPLPPVASPGLFEAGFWGVA